MIREITLSLFVCALAAQAMDLTRAAVEKQRKPRGVAKIRAATRDTDYSTAPAALIFANIRGLSLRDVRVIWDAPGAPPDRHASYAAGVEDLTVSGFAGAPAGSKLAAIGMERVRRAFVTHSRTEAGVPWFIGLSGTPEAEVVLSGNDLAKAAKVIGAGGTYVHLPQ